LFSLITMLTVNDEKTLTQIPAEGKGGAARNSPKETGAQSCEGSRAFVAWQQENRKALGVAFTRVRDRLLVTGVARRRGNSSTT
jgi:hypothetical protein